MLGLLALSSLVSGTARAQAPWLDGVMAGLAQVGERRATFEEERRIGALTRPLVSHGLLVWRRPGHLEKTTIAPRPEALVVDGDRLTLTAGGDAPRTVSLASQPQIAALVEAIRGPLSGDLAGLRRVFTVQPEGAAAAWRITLTPIEPQVAALVRSVTVEGAQATIRVITTEQSNGDVQRMTITDQSPS